MDITASFKELELNYETAHVRDLINKRDIGNFSGNLKRYVKKRSALMFKICSASNTN